VDRRGLLTLLTKCGFRFREGASSFENLWKAFDRTNSGQLTNVDFIAAMFFTFEGVMVRVMVRGYGEGLW